jgi:methionyl-tRNA formyltransferase
MKYVFFGTPEFAAIIVKRLCAAGMPPVAVVTNPDRPRGRKKIITPSPVKAVIMDCGPGVAVLQPEALDESFVAALRRIGADFGVLAAYGAIIPRAVIDVFPNGIIAVHPSLLPEYRGATPIQAAILNGDAETGTTLFLMDERVDHAPVLARRTLPVAPSDTYDALMRALAALSADALLATLPRYAARDRMPIPQDESRATYTKKLSAQDGFVASADFAAARSGADPEKAEAIFRTVRALNPEPGAWTMYGGKRMKILEADLVSGKLVVKKIQFDGELPRATFPL